MKSVIFGIAGLGVGGAAIFGFADGPDFDRIVNRRPIEVYAAFSALAQEGILTQPARAGFPASTLKVTKVIGQSIHYEIDFSDRPALTADLHFEPAGEGGRQTRMTAELDLDGQALGSAFETDAGMALSMVPERVIDAQFASFMEGMVHDVESGRPLPALGLGRTGIRQAREGATLSERRYEAQSAQRAAARPMSDAAPMVDPNQAAHAYLHPRPADQPGWGR